MPTDSTHPSSEGNAETPDRPSSAEHDSTPEQLAPDRASFHVDVRNFFSGTSNADMNDLALYLIIRDVAHGFLARMTAEDIGRLGSNPETLVAALLSELGRRTWNNRALGKGPTDALDAAVAILQQALNLCSPSDQRTCIYLEQLGSYKWEQFRLCGRSEDLAMAIQLHRMALDAFVPGATDHCNLLISLGICLITRFREVGERRDLEEATQAQLTALKLRPPGHPQRVQSLTEVAINAQARFMAFGLLNDLEDAISLQREALDLLSPHRLAISVPHNLAVSLTMLFQYNRAFDAIDEAVRLHRATVIMCPPGHPFRDISMTGLANALQIRYEAFMSLNDVNECIPLYREILVSRNRGHPRRPWTLNSLAMMLGTRSKHSAVDDDLTEGIKYIWEALELSNADHPQHAALLLNYATLLAERYRLHGSENNRLMIICATLNALRIYQDGHPDRSNCLILLGELCVRRAERLMHHVLLQDGRDYSSHSVALATRKFSPQLNRYLLQALEHVSEALADTSCSPYHLLARVALLLNSLLAVGNDEDVKAKLLATYKKTLRLLPRVSYFGMADRTRLRALRYAQRLAVNSASLAASLHQFEAAIESIEEGRATFWTQALRLRTQFDDVPPHLREPLRRISRQLDQGSRTESAPDSTRGVRLKAKLEADAAFRRRLGLEFEELIKQVRALPGFDRFMLATPFSSFVQCATNGPVVVLIPSIHGCCALVIKSVDGGVEHIPLPEISVHGLKELTDTMKIQLFRGDERPYGVSKLRPRGTGFDQLSLLWTTVVHPIMMALGLPRSSGPGAPRRRFFWCPTGAFTFLPLHAAGIYEESRMHCCSDYVVSSYTPTLTALLNARKPYATDAMSTNTKVLLIAEPNAPGLRSLPGTLNEVKALSRILPPGSLLHLGGVSTLAPESGVTLSMVNDVIGDAAVAHLACHGVQDTVDALESGFCLRDGRLTIGALMRLQLQKAIFAFCSACETAKGDAGEPDQAVHLAAAMLFAGFKTVIGTMWSMNDRDGPIVAQIVYGELFKDGVMDVDVIPYALDRAVQKLRVEGVSPSRWAPYIHIGR